VLIILKNVYAVYSTHVLELMEHTSIVS